MTLTITSREAPVEADLPVAALAAQLRLPDGWETVPGQYARLAGRLRAALERVEQGAGRALLSREVNLAGRAPGGRLLMLAVAPVDAVSAVRASGAELDLAGCVIETDGAATKLCLARPVASGAAMEAAVSAGFGPWSSIPQPLQEAVLLAAEALDDGGRRELDEQVTRLIAPFRSLRLRHL